MTVSRGWMASRAMQGALAILAVSILALGWTIRTALRPSDVAAAPATVSVVAGALDRGESAEAVNVGLAFEADLFAVDRKAPGARYRMPGEPAPVVVVEPPRPIVLGTAVSADGSSFATCQLGTPRLLMVRVGEKVGEYLVKSIERGRVTFASSTGKTFDVLAPRTGS